MNEGDLALMRFVGGNPSANDAAAIVAAGYGVWTEGTIAPTEKGLARAYELGQWAAENEKTA